MTKSSSASRASTFPRAPLLPNAAIAGTPFSMPTLAPPLLACVPSGPTIAWNFSTGHHGRRSGRRRDPSAAPSCRSTRRSASLQRRESSGRAHDFDPKKMRKVELRSYAEIKAKNLREQTAMKRLKAILLGLSVGLTTVAATFAYDGGGIQV